MLSKESNELVTRSGPGTPLGGLLRAYWQPLALVSEFDELRPVKPVRLLGENLVLFRSDDGWALISRFCAHRGADLAYGRLEGGALRCLYHGWLYGSDGRCLEQPAEPPQSRFAAEIRIASYPCAERNGFLFGYLGAGDPPPFPSYDQWAVESVGPIQDRTVERLGVSDRAVTANRRLLLRAIQAFVAGQPAPGLARTEEVALSLTGPMTGDTIAPSVSWEQHWRQREAEGRAASPWASREANADREAKVT